MFPIHPITIFVDSIHVHNHKTENKDVNLVLKIIIYNSILKILIFNEDRISNKEVYICIYIYNNKISNFTRCYHLISPETEELKQFQIENQKYNYPNQYDFQNHYQFENVGMNPDQSNDQTGTTTHHHAGKTI